jgi:hypothetical protein
LIRRELQSGRKRQVDELVPELSVIRQGRRRPESVCSEGRNMPGPATAIEFLLLDL